MAHGEIMDENWSFLFVIPCEFQWRRAIKIFLVPELFLNCTFLYLGVSWEGFCVNSRSLDYRKCRVTSTFTEPQIMSNDNSKKPEEVVTRMELWRLCRLEKVKIVSPKWFPVILARYPQGYTVFLKCWKEWWFWAGSGSKFRSNVALAHINMD